MQAEYVRNDYIIEKIVQNKWFWLVFCTFFFAYPVFRSMNRELPSDLPIYSIVPDFNLTDENGNPFGSKDLKGKTYIANFHFTSCPTICPELMKTMQQIQNRVRGVGQSVAITSFTVDPKTDTPKVLFKKARELNANPYVWKFLTGTQKDLESLLIQGFKVPMGDKEVTDIDLYDISHSGRLVLVDVEGRIRGYYTTERASIDKLMIDVGLLINRSKLKIRSKGDSGV